ncbi:VOC family protein [Methylococcus sp. EFPC2]|uniref:VOC family protein n=1 Tax=Methylococcus sp. EFPC2 TaxID=2812648 RepID=UPI001967FC27|nr:VOC family protein [Methylococcus sp. EFPC2]QSA96719.1 VOC family protein [Methylococcus sp. EFPC2]
MSYIVSLHHASVLVSDLPRARAFYEGVLGLTPSPKRPPLAYDGAWYEIGEQQVHLIALPSPEAGLVRPAHGGRDRHTALLVRDFDGLRAHLDALGVKYTVSVSGRRALFCRDPDDNALEMIAIDG